MFDQMVERTSLWTFWLIFGGGVGEREGVLVMGFGCHGEVIWCTNFKWSSWFLFLDSFFGNYIGAMGLEFGGDFNLSCLCLMRSFKRIQV